MRQGWCDIPSDLLYEIDEELTYIEKVRVRATCVWWNSFLPKLPNHNLPQLPWLLHTNVDNEGRKSQALFNLCERKSYRVDLPQLQGKFLKGSTHGWLVTISVDQNETTPSTPDICLVNPFTGVQFQLPPRSTYPDVEKYYPGRAGEEYSLIERKDDFYDIGSNHVHLWLTQMIVTSSANIESCVVAAMYTGIRKVAWCRPGHVKWTHLDIFSNTSLEEGSVQDIIFSNNKLYVLNTVGRLFEVEFSGDLDPNITVIVGQKLSEDKIGNHMFVAECSDQRLKMVVRTVENIFQVHELDVQNSCWSFTNAVGDDLLFLGYNHALSVPACRFPDYSGNRIHFADDDDLIEYNHVKGDALVGTYNFEEGRMEKLDGFPDVRRSVWPQPIWVTPPTYGQS